jgi:hypothetical protein
MAFVCLFHRVSYLGFNVLLSGTHQRYLYVGYPFLLLGLIWFYSQKIVISRPVLLASLFAAFTYGCFIYSQISNAYLIQSQQYLGFKEPPSMPMLPQWLSLLERHHFLAAVHLFILIVLLFMWVKICKNKVLENLEQC